MNKLDELMDNVECINGVYRNDKKENNSRLKKRNLVNRLNYIAGERKEFYDNFEDIDKCLEKLNDVYEYVLRSYYKENIKTRTCMCGHTISKVCVIKHIKTEDYVLIGSCCVLNFLKKAGNDLKEEINEENRKMDNCKCGKKKYKTEKCCKKCLEQRCVGCDKKVKIVQGKNTIICKKCNRCKFPQYTGEKWFINDEPNPLIPFSYIEFLWTKVDLNSITLGIIQEILNHNCDRCGGGCGGVCVLENINIIKKI